MVKMINCFTGTEFWVADDRVDEYKAAGHKLAADLEKTQVRSEAGRKARSCTGATGGKGRAQD